jgi:hypothetical protein
MTDRELLELAAKAARYEGWTYHEGDNGMRSPARDGRGHAYWSPLTDDGDALRLAVRLGMEVYVDNHPRGCACTEAESHTHKVPPCRSVVNHEDDAYAATRRAIVVCAAEIGRALSGG